VTPGLRSFRYDDVEALTASVLAAKAGRTVSVCVPCRNEAATIGPLVASVRSALMKTVEVIDELIVIDDGSGDDTAAVAADAGAEVVPIGEISDQLGPGRGKGNALWASLLASRGDIVVWCDGDVTSLRPDWIVKLVAPLLLHPELVLVKAAYARPQHRGGGGRTTELVARPLLSFYYPLLAQLDQPLAGEYAVRRSTVAHLPMVQGWGVEVALLIDTAERFGPGALAQVDLGVRDHRHRPLEELAVQAAEVAATILGRAGANPPGPPSLIRSGGAQVELNLAERPPLVRPDRP
jgi:glucosyl-3-phosphoglycerate synthase